MGVLSGETLLYEVLTPPCRANIGTPPQVCQSEARIRHDRPADQRGLSGWIRSKILLSLYRRLMTLREYIEEEKVDSKKSFQ